MVKERKGNEERGGMEEDQFYSNIFHSFRVIIFLKNIE